MLGDPQYDIEVQERYWNWSVAVYLINRGGEGVFMGKIVKGRLTWEKIKEGGEYPDEPTLLFNRDVWEVMKQSLTKNHERDKHTVEAELGATKYHLEDMRRLVFEPTITNEPLNQLKEEKC